MGVLFFCIYGCSIFSGSESASPPRDPHRVQIKGWQATEKKNGKGFLQGFFAGHPFSQPRYLWMSSLLFMGVLFIPGAGVPGPPLTRIDFKFRAGKQRRKNRTPIFSTEIFMDVLLFAFMGVLFIPGAGVPGPP